MAKAGRPFYYHLSAKELADRIDSYFTYLKENPTVKGGPSDFLVHVEMDHKLASEITKNPPGGYEQHSKLMKQAAVRVRAHLETSPAWGNNNSTKSIFLTKQRLWDGLSYADTQDNGAKATGTIKIVFGTGPISDPGKFFK